MSLTVSNTGLVESNIQLTGKTAIITGSNSGIGYETALDFAKRGAKIILACRNSEKATAARERIIASSECKAELIVFKPLNLASFKSVRDFADAINKEESRLDILVNNAGVMMCPQTTTEDGFEMQLQVNHLSHFLLTNLLLDLLKKSAPSRIINLSSILHEKGSINWNDLNMSTNYKDQNGYYQSKLMNVLFTRELCKKLEGTGVTANSVHPGYVQTDITRHINRTGGNFLWKCRLLFSYMPIVESLIWVDSKQGAQTTIFCAIAPQLENTSGKYFSNFKITKESKQARNDKSAERLWNISKEMTKL